MPKDFSLQNLFRDLEYTIFGTEVHQLLFKVSPPEENKRVLEMGCGCGKFGIAYALAGCDVVMMDIDEQVIDYARRIRDAANSLQGHKSPTFIYSGDLFKMTYKADSFDLVFNEGVPQHWPDEERRQGAIDLMVKVSRRDVIVIGNNGLREEEQEADRNFKFTYEGMPPHRRCFIPDELFMSLRKAGLEGVEVGPVTPGKIEDSYLIGGWGRKT